MLIGLPGAGKSTYAKELEDQGYIRINQDMFDGDRAAATEAFNKALETGKNIVLDRCNITREQRTPWLNKAMYSGYEERIALVFQVDPDECIARIQAREGHETIPKDTPIEKIKSIVYGFNKSKQDPVFAEGFTVMMIK